MQIILLRIVYLALLFVGVCREKKLYTDKNENKIFLILKEIQMGSGAKLFMRKGFLI
jgi:hypothetical protein